MTASPPPVPGTDLAAYYDRLSLWTRLARPFGYGGGVDALTVHRLLRDPRAHGVPTATRLHDCIAEALPPLDAPRLLDAGCGLGGTIFDLMGRFGGSAVGLTLSPAQCAVATRAAAMRGVESRVRIVVRSYDDPPAGPFDVIVGIESLAHSPDPASSLAALARVLTPGGHFVLVDDMPEPGAAGTTDLEAFKVGWGVPVLWSRDAYLRAFGSLGLEVIASHDLTGESAIRSLTQISRLERLNRLACRLAPLRWQIVLDSYYGGLALERLYRRGLMGYRLLVARRPPSA